VAPAVCWLADAEVGATAVVDPEASLVESPCAAANAGRAADLANELNVAAVADVAPVSFPVVGRAGDELRLWRRRGHWTAAADSKVGAAAVVDPEAALVETPGAPANTGRAADLTDKLDIAAVANGAPVSFAIVGGAVDGLAGRWAGWPAPSASAASADYEVGTAALVNPETSAVDTPSASLNAG
jgi:hypothetical protein